MHEFILQIIKFLKHIYNLKLLVSRWRWTSACKLCIEENARYALAICIFQWHANSCYTNTAYIIIIECIYAGMQRKAHTVHVQECMQKSSAGQCTSCDNKGAKN